MEAVSEQRAGVDKVYKDKSMRELRANNYQTASFVLRPWIKMCSSYSTFCSTGLTTKNSQHNKLEHNVALQGQCTHTSKTALKAIFENLAVSEGHSTKATKLCFRGYGSDNLTPLWMLLKSISGVWSGAESLRLMPASCLSGGGPAPNSL